MKHLKKVLLVLLAITVFTYTSFAVVTSNIQNQNQLIGRSQEVKLTKTKNGQPIRQGLTPLVVVVVILIAAVSTSPAYSGTTGKQKPPPTPSGESSQTLQQIAIHNLD